MAATKKKSKSPNLPKNEHWQRNCTCQQLSLCKLTVNRMHFTFFFLQIIATSERLHIPASHSFTTNFHIARVSPYFLPPPLLLHISYLVKWRKSEKAFGVFFYQRFHKALMEAEDSDLGLCTAFLSKSHHSLTHKFASLFCNTLNKTHWVVREHTGIKHTSMWQTDL